MHQTVVQFAGRHVLADRHLAGQRDRTRIQALVHLHHHHAGLFIAGHDRALDGGRPSPARQQRSMAVVAAVACPVEDCLGQKQAVGDNDGDIGAEGAKALALFLLPEIDGGQHCQAEQLRRLMDRRFLQIEPAAPARPRRLGIDGDDLMTGIEQQAQSGNRKFRRSHEYDAKRHSISPVERSAVFKRVYELEIKPFEVFCIAGRERRAMRQADGGDHGVLGFHWTTRFSTLRG